MADPIRQEVDRVRLELAHMIELRVASGDSPGEWLRVLYQAYAERMRSDNERIWSTGAIFVPICLSAFAALLAIEAPALWKTNTLAGVSIALIVLWLVIAENHRSFQQESQAWMIAILEVIGITEVGDDKVVGNWLNKLLTRRGAVQVTRWLLAVLVTIAWGVIIEFQSSGRILRDEPGLPSVPDNRPLQPAIGAHGPK